MDSFEQKRLNGRVKFLEQLINDYKENEKIYIANEIAFRQEIARLTKVNKYKERKVAYREKLYVIMANDNHRLRCIVDPEYKTLQEEMAEKKRRTEDNCVYINEYRRSDGEDWT